MRPHVVHWLEGLLPGNLASALAPTWFTCVGLAGVVALLAMRAIARRHRVEAGAVASIVLWCYVAAVTAGIAVPAAIDAAQQLLTTGRAHVRWAGMTSFWGYLAGGCAVAAVCRGHAIPLRRFADLTVAPLGIALMLARLGCFLAGCDYGKVTALPWAVRFPAHSPAWQDHVDAGLVAAGRAGSLPVHPTQLYEAALGLVIAGVALAAARRRWAQRGDGRVFALAAAMYALGRLAIEDLRGDAGRGIYLGLSSGQIFSLVVLAAIAAALWLRRLRPTAATAAAAAAAAAALALIAPRTAGAQPAPAPQPPTAAPRPPAAGPQRPGAAPQRPDVPPAASTQSGQPYGPPTAPPSGSGAPPGSPPGPYAPAQPPSGPADPYAPTSAPPPPGPYAQPQPPPTGAPGGRASIHIGALAGIAAPFNRRRDQVATLGGGSLSLGFGLGRLGLWLDLDSFGNRDASHGTILLSGGAMARIADRLWIGGRFGLGATLVNFDDPAFRDVVGSAVRFEALVDYRLGDAWAVWLRPLSFDVLSAADLGGPIATWQARIGVAYHFALGRTAPAGGAR